MIRLLVLVPILMLTLSACATTPNSLAPRSIEADRASAKQLHTDLVREMIAQGRYYAALAHIEELQKSGGPKDELLLLHAQVLAKLNRNDQAEQEYRQLLGSAFDGEAKHGLGLLYALKDFRLSLQYLRQAANLRPTDPNIRNDYGYALLTGGHYPAARLELATAYELDSAMDRYRNNYVLALLISKDEAEIRRVRQRSDISDKVLQNLRAQAQGWPAVVQRTTRTATAIAADATPSRAVSKPSVDNRNSVKKKLGVPGSN